MSWYCVFLLQITGDANVAGNALLQVLMRLRANTFEMEGAFPAFSPGLSYVPMSASIPDGSRYGNRDNRSRRHGYSSYSGGHDYNDLSPSDSYGGSQVNTQCSFFRCWFDVLIFTGKNQITLSCCSYSN